MATQAERRASTIDAILRSAHHLFMAQGFDQVSIDDIAGTAGVRKGGVYHHFASKQDIFQAVLERVQGELAHELEARIASNTSKRTPRTIANNVRVYLEATNAPGLRQVLLIDGPVVLGWNKWREIDDRYFFTSLRSGLAAIIGSKADRQQVNCAARLIAGSVFEALLDLGSTNDPNRTARAYCTVLERMLEGLQVKDPAE